MKNPAGGKSKNATARVKDSITLSGETFSVGDCILVKGEASEPYVGRIVSFTKDQRGKTVRVNWFYRPEECEDGRKEFHGDKELFKCTDHSDKIEPQTIIGKCQVHTLNQYRELEDELDTDFFSRFTYWTKDRKFTPETVPVYCVCELPYNPDCYMIMCEQCQEWYHPRCIGLSSKDVEHYNDAPFTCMACKGAQQAATVA